MTAHDYLERVREILAHYEDEQADVFDAAATLVIDAFDNGGAVYCHHLGHGLERDSIHRAGGLVGVKRFDFNVRVNAEVPACRRQTEPGPADRDLEQVRFAVRQSGLRPGDVMVLASVSGKNRAPVELALACAEAGMRTIAFSALPYTQNVTSLHPSGKRLYEVADVTIDLRAPYGDAAVTVPGIDVAGLPVSDVAMAAGARLLWGRGQERMAAAGNPPSVLMSVNRDGGPDYNQTSEAAFDQRGY